MKQYIAAGIMAACIACATGGYLYGQHIGSMKAEFDQQRIDKAISDSAQASRQAVSEEIAKIQPINKTIHQKVQREIQTETIYADCRVPPSGLRLANQAIAGHIDSPDELPKSGGDSAGR